jgi:hypothetical protein
MTPAARGSASSSSVWPSQPTSGREKATARIPLSRRDGGRGPCVVGAGGRSSHTRFSPRSTRDRLLNSLLQSELRLVAASWAP